MSTASLKAGINEGGTLFANYRRLPGVYDEIINEVGHIRKEVATIAGCINELDSSLFHSFHNKAQHMLADKGVTFSVYNNCQEADKIFPFDIVPRVIAKNEWYKIEKGLQQRVLALNEFLKDIYQEQKILTNNIIPKALVYTSQGYLPKLRYVKPLSNVYIHISGIDLVRKPNGELVVLEDNLRTPSGISYVLENRAVMKTLFHDLFSKVSVRDVETYPFKLQTTLRSLTSGREENIVVLTPGPYNSAYFEHVFLARKMGCPLVTPDELYVDDHKVFLKTIDGPIRVHIIYRRIDDEYLDTIFNPKSLLSIPGIVGAYARGNVMLANALGNGVADDKAIYSYVPEMIKFYLSEEPILSQVTCYPCFDEDNNRYVMQHLDELVVKVVNQSGGYGIFIGPQASRHQINEMRKQIKANPRKYIAEPLIKLSTCPTWSDGELNARHVDLRPYILYGKSIWVLPGALTRVALKKGSYIVNSSQGGGAKDTWVLA